jgi:hypothetical protein
MLPGLVTTGASNPDGCSASGAGLCNQRGPEPHKKGSVCIMAKATKADLEAGGQLELIEVDDPAYKDVKRELIGYEKLVLEAKEQHAADKKAEEAKRKKVLAAIVAANIKPDAEGVYHLTFGGKQWSISQESQLKIKHKKAPAKDSQGTGGEGE